LILAVDTSALLRRYAPDAHHQMVVDVMDEAHTIVASALALTELLVCTHRMAINADQADAAASAVQADWTRWASVPVDSRCLARASEIGTAFRVRIADAIHLAAADRLPRPVHFLSLDRRQLPAAAALGFEVIAPVER